MFVLVARFRLHVVVLVLPLSYKFHVCVGGQVSLACSSYCCRYLVHFHVCVGTQVSFSCSSVGVAVILYIFMFVLVPRFRFHVVVLVASLSYTFSCRCWYPGFVFK